MLAVALLGQISGLRVNGRGAQTVLVAGATQPLGARVVAHFARAGDLVIALDEDEDALVALARRYPSQVSHVRVPAAERVMIEELGAA